MISAKTDQDIVQEIGSRLRAYRLQQNMTIKEISEAAGLDPNTIVNAEAGKSPRLSTLVQILRALGRLEALDSFLPAPGISPLQLVKLQGKPRQRARKASHG